MSVIVSHESDCILVTFDLYLWPWELFYLNFIARRSYAIAVLGVVALSVRLSVCPSVSHTRALWQNQTMHCGYFGTTRKGNHASFLTPTVVGGRGPFRLKFAFKVTHPFDKRRLRQISTYNVSTVKDSERVQPWQIGSRPRAFHRAIDWVRTLSPKYPKGGSKAFFVFFK